MNVSSGSANCRAKPVCHRYPSCGAPSPKELTACRSEADLDPPTLWHGSLTLYQPLQLQLITELSERRRFQQYLQRFHPLGYRVPYGAQLRYFVRSQQPPYPTLACLLFASAAWKMAPRDQWIGWSDAARQTNLPLLVNNSRFLILPGVKVPHLASHVLALAAHRLPSDGEAAYGVRPVLLETLVDRPYAGTCYPLPIGSMWDRRRAAVAWIAPIGPRERAKTSSSSRFFGSGDGSFARSVS